VSTMALILSVTEAKVCPGSMTGAVGSISEDLLNCSDSIAQPVLISGLGFVSLARYVVRGFVFSSVKRP
jgi:hypothetical protein